MTLPLSHFLPWPLLMNLKGMPNFWPKGVTEVTTSSLKHASLTNKYNISNRKNKTYLVTKLSHIRSLTKCSPLSSFLSSINWWLIFSFSPLRKGWVTWVCSASRKEDWEGILLMFINIISVGVKRTWPTSFQQSVGTGQGETGKKLEHRKFHTNMWRNFFTVRVTDHWSMLPREVVESPSLEIIKTHLDAYLCSLL